MQSTIQKILCSTLLLSLGLLYVPHVFAVIGDVQLDVSTGGQIIGSALITNKFTDAANTDYYLDPAASTTSLTVAGNVGIGTTGPISKLTVDASSGLPNATYATTVANSSLAINDAGVSSLAMMFGVAPSTPATWIQNQFSGSEVTAYLLLNPIGGNVGIGTTSPNATLQVAGTFHAPGSIVQVVSTMITTNYDATVDNGWTDNVVTLAITPKFANSILLVSVGGDLSCADAGADPHLSTGLRIMVGTTKVAGTLVWFGNTDTSHIVPIVAEGTYSPGSTAQVTFGIQLTQRATTDGWWNNAGDSGPTTFKIMEIAQ